MLYPLIQKNDEGVLKEGFSLYTPYTSLYEIDEKEVEKFYKQIKNILIYSKLKGIIVNTLTITQILKSKELKTKL